MISSLHLSSLHNLILSPLRMKMNLQFNSLVFLYIFPCVLHIIHKLKISLNLLLVKTFWVNTHLLQNGNDSWIHHNQYNHNFRKNVKNLKRTKNFTWKLFSDSTMARNKSMPQCLCMKIPNNLSLVESLILLALDLTKIITSRK